MRKFILTFVIFMVTGLFLSGCESNEEKDTIELTEHQKAWIADIDGEIILAISLYVIVLP